MTPAQTKLDPRAEGFRLLEEARFTLIRMEAIIERGLDLVLGRDDFMSADDENRIEEAQRLVVIAQSIIERYLTDNTYEND